MLPSALDQYGTHGIVGELPSAFDQVWVAWNRVHHTGCVQTRSVAVISASRTGGGLFALPGWCPDPNKALRLVGVRVQMLVTATLPTCM